MAKSKFELGREIEKYAESLTSDIFSPKKRAEIKREYAEHIEDAVYRYKLCGMEEKEAFKKACADMGDISKTRFLLAEVHNNKVQLYIVDRILRPIKKLFTSRRFLRGLLLFAIGFGVIFAFLFYALISVIGGESFFRGIAELLARSTILIYVFLPIVIFVIVLLFLFPMLSLLYPPLRMLYERCTRYFSLFFWSLFRGYSYRINKFNFHNAYKIDECPNIIIKKKGKKYALHFLDIPRGHKKIFVLVNDFEYRIYDTDREKAVSFIRNNYHTIENEDIPKVFRGSGRIIDEDSYRTYKLPNISDTDNIEHIVLIFPKFAYSKRMADNRLVDITSDMKIGGMRFFNYKAFKKNKYYI